MKVKTEICNAFNAQAHAYEAAAKIQQEIGHRLISRLEYIKIAPRYVLDLGCGTGLFSLELKRRYPDAQIIGLDLAYQMLQQAKLKQTPRDAWSLVNADLASMPFPDGMFDLVFANQAIHWAIHMPTAIAELNRIMNVNGCLLFSTLGPDTFAEIQHAWASVDHYMHTNAFYDMHDLGDLLLEEQWLDPVVDMEYLIAQFPGFNALIRSLKDQGVRNVSAQRRAGLTGVAAWKQFAAAMNALKSAEDKLPLTYEVIYGHAWKGQQRKTHQGIETMIPISMLKQGKI